MSVVRRIAVVGAGSVGWLAACALARALRHRNLEVTLVGPAPDNEPAVRGALPSLRALHGLLGIAEGDFLRATGATFRLASEHGGWRGAGSSFFFAHGDIGVDLNGTPFYKYLLREILAGRDVAPQQFSLAALAAINGRFARPMGDDKALASRFTYGFHVGEAAYAQYLAGHAARFGVRRVPADVAQVATAAGAISALRLVNGETVTADLYLDCTGNAARLISCVDTSLRVDWRNSLPCDRMWTLFTPPIADAPPMTQTQVTDAGWYWRAPLARQGAVGLVYCSDLLSDDRARAALAEVAGASGEASLVRLHSGRRSKFWVGNCVALGAAAAELEPLAGADLQIAALGLAALVELFPVAQASAVEAAEYCRIMAEHADGLRDFVLAHYHAGALPAGAFWDRVRDAPLPDRLAHKLNLYFASGRIQLFDFETFEETDWAWLLLGGRRAPRSLEAQVFDRVAQIRADQVAALRDQLARLVSTMPRHMDFVRHQSFQQRA